MAEGVWGEGGGGGGGGAVRRRNHIKFPCYILGESYKRHLFISMGRVCYGPSL